MSEVFICNTNGNDTTGAGTEAQPWKTVQKAFDNVLVAGGGGSIRPSNESAFVFAASPNWTQFNINNTTSSDNPLTISPWDTGGSLVIDHPYGNIDCFEIDGDDAVSTLFSTASMPQHVMLVQGKLHSTTGKLIDPANYWTLLLDELYGNGATAMVDQAGRLMAIGCHLHAFAANSKGFYSSPAGCLAYNYIDSPTGIGIQTGGDTLVYGNILGDCVSKGMWVGGDGNVVSGNTIVGKSTNTHAGIYVGSSSERNICLDNIITDYSNASGAGIEVAGGGNFALIGHNHFHNNTTDKSGAVVKGLDLGGDVVADPGFVDAAGGDFRIGLAGKAKGWPRGWPGSATLNFLDTGAVQAIMGRQMRLRQ